MQNAFHIKNMNLLLKDSFLKELFTVILKRKFPQFYKIHRITIWPVKDSSRNNQRHLVIIYNIRFLDKAKQQRFTKIVTTAHSDGSRKQIYKYLKFVYKNLSNDYTALEPICYLEEFRALFYFGYEGQNMYSWILKEEYPLVFWGVKQLAPWLANFHNIKTYPGKLTTNKLTLKTLDPTDILKKNALLNKKYNKILLSFYKQIKKLEKKYFNNDLSHNCLSHGDLHPENILYNKEKKDFVIIDFSELKTAHFTYDLASFLAQLGAMCRGYSIKNFHFDNKKIILLQKNFLQGYFKNSKRKYTKKTEKQILVYMTWLALRGAIYFLGAKKEKDLKYFIHYLEYYLNLIKSNKFLY